MDSPWQRVPPPKRRISRICTAARYPLSTLRERYHNRGLCRRCRTILRECGDATRDPYWPGNNRGCGVLEESIGKNCLLCLLFLSVLPAEGQRSRWDRKYRETSHIAAWRFYTTWLGLDAYPGSGVFDIGLGLVDPKGSRPFIHVEGS